MDPGCRDDVCVTCADQAVPVTVARMLSDGLAEVVTERGTEEVSVALVVAQVGDTVLVHAGEAIAVLERGASRVADTDRVVDTQDTAVPVEGGGGASTAAGAVEHGGDTRPVRGRRDR